METFDVFFNNQGTLDRVIGFHFIIKYFIAMEEHTLNHIPNKAENTYVKEVILNKNINTANKQFKSVKDGEKKYMDEINLVDIVKNNKQMYQMLMKLC